MTGRAELGPDMLRAVCDGELFSAADAAGLVRLLHATARFHGPTTSDEAYMRESAARAGGSIRYDTPEHYIEDMHHAGYLELLKREWRESPENQKKRL
jgi:hypothetical protein